MSAWGREKKTWTCPRWSCVIIWANIWYDMGKKDRIVHILWKETNLKRLWVQAWDGWCASRLGVWWCLTLGSCQRLFLVLRPCHSCEVLGSRYHWAQWGQNYKELVPPLTDCSTRENWFWPSANVALRRVGPAPHHLGSTGERTLSTGTQVSCPRKSEHGRAGSIHTSCQSCGGTGEGEMPLLAPCPLLLTSRPPDAGRKVDPWVKKVRELALPLTSCHTWESGHCFYPG